MNIVHKTPTSSRGFTPVLVALIIVFAVVTAGVGAYFVLSKDESGSGFTSENVDRLQEFSQAEEIQSVSAVVEQIDAEAALEDSLMLEEENELQYDETVLNSLGDLSNENNL